MARKGEKLITQVELEARMRAANKRIDSLLDFLVFIFAVGVKDFMFQAGHDEFSGTIGTAKSFPTAFKTGTVPIVVITSTERNCVVTMNGRPTATGFIGYGRLISDGSNYTTEADWLALGVRG